MRFTNFFLILQKGNTGFSMGTALSVDPENKTVTTDRETISYDKLIIAIGTTNNFFNIFLILPWI